MYHTFFQWGTSKEARAQVIIAGLNNPTPDVSRAIAEAEAASKGKHSYLLPLLIPPLTSLTYP